MEPDTVHEALGSKSREKYCVISWLLYTTRWSHFTALCFCFLDCKLELVCINQI